MKRENAQKEKIERARNIALVSSLNGRYSVL